MRFLRIFGGQTTERRVRHYFALAIILIGAGLTGTALLEGYFRYLENWEHFGQVQKENATAGAFKIEQFIREIERDIRAATRSREIVSNGISQEYKWELRRLLVNTPAVKWAIAFDLEGTRVASASRHSSIWENVSPPLELERGQTVFGPAVFTDEGPFMTIAVPIERFAGETIGILAAGVDLKYVWEVIEDIQVGESGRAYLVSQSGSLIAHPDITLVLQRRNLKQHPAVKAAFRGSVGSGGPRVFAVRDMTGNEVYTTYALIPGLNWAVLTEQPVGELYAPLFASILRTSGVLLLGIGVAVLATLFVRRRVVSPVERLRKAVEDIRGGDLSSRVNLKTGDEFEILSDEFNQMAATLEQAYEDLENKVAERTQQLGAANLRLEDASRHKSQFLANVNHELRTPLSAIIGYARLLRRETEGQISELQKENLNDLLQNAERLLRMIDSLLDLSRIEAGKMIVRRQEVVIAELIDWAVAAVTPMLDHDRVRIVRDIATGLPIVRSDPDLLRQILLNLVANAAKFTDEGEIRVFARQEGGSLSLGVSDTGIGIVEAEIDEIFEEFRQGAMSRSRGQVGSGLGLAIVKRFATLLGGEVLLKSELGKGSTFTVTLPLDRA